MLKRLLRYLLGDEEAPVRAPAPPDLPGVVQIDAIRVILPELPSEYTGEYVVSSESEAGVEYHVDLTTLCCTCPDFVRRRAHLADREVGRICKHIARILIDTGAVQEYNEPWRTVIRTSRTKPFYVPCKTARGAEILLGVDPDQPEWIDVFARRERKGDAPGVGTGVHARFGFSLTEWRWAYGEAPPDQDEVEAAIAAALGRRAAR